MVESYLSTNLTLIRMTVSKEMSFDGGTTTDAHATVSSLLTQSSRGKIPPCVFFHVLAIRLLVIMCHG